MTSKKAWVDNPLSILVSARIRLTHDQRRTLKDAYVSMKNADRETETVGHGGIAVQTSYGTGLELERKLGMSHLVFSDLVNTRDTISLNIILQLQQALEVEIITQKDIEDACKGYIAYMFDR